MLWLSVLCTFLYDMQIFFVKLVKMFLFTTYYQQMHNIFNLLNTKFYPIYHLLALLGAHHIPHISRIRVNT